MNIYKLTEINEGIQADAAGFVAQCDRNYEAQLEKAAEGILANRQNSPIVLLSGPSGSGKTTSAMKIEGILETRGIQAHTISLDNYFLDITEDSPRNEKGELDFETPKCLDMELLNQHFTILSQEGEVEIPHFDFPAQKRSDRHTKLRLRENEVAIFEGIHALNDDIYLRHPEAFGLYVSVRSRIQAPSGALFNPRWVRFLRRVVRDEKFRGASAETTVKLWVNVIRGEELYILPFKHRANVAIDTLLPYELGVMKRYALKLFDTLPLDCPLRENIDALRQGLELFAPVADTLVAPQSLLREFIGGGIYHY